MTEPLRLVCPWCQETWPVAFIWHRKESVRTDGMRHPSDRARAWVMADVEAGAHTCRRESDE